MSIKTAPTWRKAASLAVEALGSKVDFSLFCDSIGDYARPFLQGGFVYATDGRIVLRINETILTVRQVRLLNVAAMDSMAFPDADSVMYPWPEKEWGPGLEDSMLECGECRGSGHNASTSLRCEACSGDGLDGRACVQRIRHLKIAAKYDWRVRTLSRVNYHISRQFGEECVAFRFAQGSGLLMPLAEVR